MPKILLVYPPFCTPASPPYSLTYLYSFLKSNLLNDFEPFQIELLDLNILFHSLKFADDQKYFQNFSQNDYDEKAKDFLFRTSQCYTENNKKVVQGENPELLDLLIQEIKKRKADVIALSIVYSSQAFYTITLLQELKKIGVKTIIGGPAVNQKLKDSADVYLKNEVDFLEYLLGEKIRHEKLQVHRVLDFSLFAAEDYFTPKLVVPLRTSNSCFYKQCSFCTHHGNADYIEHDLEDIKQTIILSGQKYFFFIDDMIPKKRLLEIAALLKPLSVFWMCQLRPTKDLDLETLQLLHDSGLKVIIWGVESGCDRILQLMKKGTQTKDVVKVLHDSHAVGIANVLYIMFGFPTETEEEFLMTIDFLKENSQVIDLISTSTFGLQKESPMFAKAKEFGIVQIRTKERTILEPQISYETNAGLSQLQLFKKLKGHKKTIEAINKFPKQMNFFREHMLVKVE